MTHGRVTRNLELRYGTYKRKDHEPLQPRRRLMAWYTLELSENNSSALSVNEKHECACASCALFTDKAFMEVLGLVAYLLPPAEER